MSNYYICAFCHRLVQLDTWRLESGALLHCPQCKRVTVVTLRVAKESDYPEEHDLDDPPRDFGDQ